MIPCTVPLGEGHCVGVQFLLVPEGHQVPHSIDVPSLRGLLQAEEGRLLVLLNTESIQVHDPQRPLRLQTAVPTSLRVPEEGLERNKHSHARSLKKPFCVRSLCLLNTNQLMALWSSQTVMVQCLYLNSTQEGIFHIFIKQINSALRTFLRSNVSGWE